MLLITLNILQDKILLMQTEHFLLLKPYLKSIQLAKHKLTHRKCNVIVTEISITAIVQQILVYKTMVIFSSC